MGSIAKRLAAKKATGTLPPPAHVIRKMFRKYVEHELKLAREGQITAPNPVPNPIDGTLATGQNE